MSFTIALIADVLVAVLLCATIGTCIVLSKRIERLKADEGAMRRTVGELVAATDNAERAIAGLKVTFAETDRTLAERLRTAERYAADLHDQIAQGEQVLARIGKIVEASRLVAPPPANGEQTNRPSASSPTPRMWPPRSRNARFVALTATRRKEMRA